MFKTIVTLMRGRAFEAEERLADRHALTLLDQQIRDAACAIQRAKKRSRSRGRRWPPPLDPSTRCGM